MVPRAPSSSPDHLLYTCCCYIRGCAARLRELAGWRALPRRVPGVGEGWVREGPFDWDRAHRVCMHFTCTLSRARGRAPVRRQTGRIMVSYTAQHVNILRKCRETEECLGCAWPPLSVCLGLSRSVSIKPYLYVCLSHSESVVWAHCLSLVLKT
jgi:hypothetical protein